MPKLERWIVASRNVEALDAETEQTLIGWGAHTGGGWKTVHRHVLVTPQNKEQIESYMAARGYSVRPVNDPSFFHPEPYEQGQAMDHDAQQHFIEYREEQKAIEQSFTRLESAPDQPLLSDTYAAIVAHDADQIARLWAREVYSHHTTAGLRDWEPDALLAGAKKTVSLLASWLNTKSSNTEIEGFFTEWGRETRRYGLKLHEFLSGISLLRREVFLHTERRSEAKRDSSIDIYRVMEFSRRLVIFFDKAAYHTAKGYEG